MKAIPNLDALLAKLEQAEVPPIIDFEASSLSFESYPISVGLYQAGRLEYQLIRPKSGWVDWSLLSEEIHGLSRAQLMEHGKDAALVLKDLSAQLNGEYVVYSDNPEYDQMWARALGLDIYFHNILELMDNMDREEFMRRREAARQELQVEAHHAGKDALVLALVVWNWMD